MWRRAVAVSMLAGVAACGGGGSDPEPASSPSPPSSLPTIVAGCLIDTGASSQSANTTPTADAGANLSVLVGQTVQLDGSASSDRDPGDLLAYAWTLRGAPVGSRASLGQPNTVRPGLTPDVPGEYVLALTVDDGCATSEPATVIVRAGSTPEAVRIRVGGPASRTADGTIFEADTHYSGGTVAATDAPISGTPDDALYQRERWGEFSYSIPIADGRYQVTLHLAERFEGITGSGQRVFSVVYEQNEPGAQWVPEIDIWKEVGPNSAYDLSREVTVSGGKLDIRFVRGVQEPKVAAISVVPIASVKPKGDRLEMLRREVGRRLAGSATLNCPGQGSVSLQVAESNLAFGGADYPLGALRTVAVGAIAPNLGSDAMNATFTYDATGGSLARQFQLSFDATGRLISVAHGGVLDTNLATCTVASQTAAWGTLGANAFAFVEGIDKPRPNYPAVPMTCTRSGVLGSGSTTEMIGMTDYRLTHLQGSPWTARQGFYGVELGRTTASFRGSVAPMGDAYAMTVDGQGMLRSYYSLPRYDQIECLATDAM